MSEGMSSGTRILVVGPPFHGYTSMIARAFREHGCITQLCEVGMEESSFVGNLRCLGPRRIRERNSLERARLNSRVVSKAVVSARPDICVVINGDFLEKGTLASINSSLARVYLWCYDSISRFPDLLLVARGCERVYVFEPSDRDLLAGRGISATVLPMGYDPALYYPMGLEHQFDISFVGTLFAYRDRLRILKRFVDSHRKLRVGIWTNTPPSYSPRRVCAFLGSLLPFYQNIRMKSLDHADINRVYNSSHICLNIHSPQNMDGLNPRTYEILGSGGFQLVDYRRQVDSVLKEGVDLACYRSEQDLSDKVDYFLENARERTLISAQGAESARRNHTYWHRVAEMLK